MARFGLVLPALMAAPVNIVAIRNLSTLILNPDHFLTPGLSTKVEFLKQ